MSDIKHVPELADILADLPRFTNAIHHLAQRLGLDLLPLEVDHIALRCHQNATAERWQQGLLRCATLFSQKDIAGRPVALFELATPLDVGPWSISVVELPWPGQRLYRHEGWEHVEVVLRGEASTLGTRALALMADEGLTQQGISIKTSAPKGDGEKLPNPTLAVTDGQVTIKFHPWSLKEIVASENEGQ
ncbi:VOC family protein [Erwinia pyrifoliae]|uniref:VOC family protein n=1 Tax=Erwinia pyrifoliae TaxID=79967 RepID=A0ABY5XBV7_ERWPY|nr:VOC family protein [Erwinia pyrifoliae]AUX72949.1 VOC family protein [Erwinia pyrifoliae]MCA8876777.1 VOC family protein [Erwinia pyrifoliae]MCT2386935.1 VOC family protein [Erwinia pyrifoliae]MCU8587466.1 VOC family protein [Erwinia pyrifoliae]UWS31312.1 VOC family protein [Erwinia pyrifoliae]